jgi:hypothetical protein
VEREGSGDFELAAGGGLGAFSAAGAALGAGVCPLCIIAVPALLGVGLIKKVKGWLR